MSMAEPRINHNAGDFSLKSSSKCERSIYCLYQAPVEMFSVNIDQMKYVPWAVVFRNDDLLSLNRHSFVTTGQGVHFSRKRNVNKNGRLPFEGAKQKIKLGSNQVWNMNHYFGGASTVSVSFLSKIEFHALNSRAAWNLFNFQVELEHFRCSVIHALVFSCVRECVSWRNANFDALLLTIMNLSGRCHSVEIKANTIYNNYSPYLLLRASRSYRNDGGDDDD